MWCSWVSLTGIFTEEVKIPETLQASLLPNSLIFFCTEISNLISVSLITFNFVSSFHALWVISVQEKNCLCDPNSYLRDRVINVETIFRQGRSVSVKSISVSVCKLNSVIHSLQRRRSAELRVYFSLSVPPSSCCLSHSCLKSPLLKTLPTPS